MKWDFEKLAQVIESYSQPSEADPAKERKRQRIIQAATESFIAQGYRKTSIGDVARQAQVAKGTVYLYVRNKSDLLVQAIVEEKRRYLQKLKPIFADGLSARERMRQYLRMVFVIGAEMPLMSRLMSGDREILLVLAEMDPAERQQVTAMQGDFLGEMLDQAAQPHRWSEGELNDRVKVLLGLIYSAGSFADERVRSGLSLPRFAELLADLIMDGVAPREPVLFADKGES